MASAIYVFVDSVFTINLLDYPQQRKYNNTNFTFRFYVWSLLSESLRA